MDTEYVKLLIDLHKNHKRQGPGGKATTMLAIELAGLTAKSSLRIADIGCGTGASSLQLARELNASITAVDFLPDFLEVLNGRAKQEGVEHAITTLCASMDDLPFADESYDVFWSEGAVYTMGFEAGISSWRRFLKPGGILVISEITWTTPDRPRELQEYWEAAYPQISSASRKIEILERNGYGVQGYFVLPAYCWQENYYEPLEKSFPAFLERNAENSLAEGIIASEQEEISIYKKYYDKYSYGMYIAKKL